jgi:NAD(P)-dependent dehydrogenase (short-subunit alcohol dehydrogenase family)
MSDLFRLDGKVALVTGGSRGIGLMMARGLVDAGATVYLSSRKADACEAAVELAGVLRARPGAVGVVGDVEEDTLGANEVANPRAGGGIVGGDAHRRADGHGLAGEIEDARHGPVGLGGLDDPCTTAELPPAPRRIIEGAAGRHRVIARILQPRERLVEGRGRAG